MIPDEVVDEVRSRADIVEVVGDVVALRRSGRNFMGKCPFHEDSSPSFSVVPGAGYRCFGCGESGDVFTFVMKREGLDFTDAVRKLGARFGVEIREVTRAGDEAEDPFRAHYEANAFARSFFREQLLDAREGRQARAYLESRGVDAETAERFGLGFASDGWRVLREAAAKHGIGEELMLEVGLLTTSPRSTEPYDRFRNRIVFPIETTVSRVVAFGGRILGPAAKGAPKYLNSPESPIYHKGEVLYALGWNRNAIRREGVALVVEGYMDVVSLAAGGVENAVATLGTAMTPEHARLLRRFTDRVLLLFDSDEAGLRATFRAADVLLEVGARPSVVTLPEGEDPDTVIRAEGAAGLRRHLDAAVDVVDRKLQLLESKGYFGSIDRTRVAVDKLLPTLRATADPALRDIYVAKVAERTGVRRATLEKELAALPAPGEVRHPPGRGETARIGRAAAGGPSGEQGGTPGRGRGPALPALGAERQLLLVLLRAREWLDRAVERIGPGEFRDPVWRAIFEALVTNPELSAPPEGMPPEVARRLEELLGDPEQIEHTQRAFEDSLAELVDRSLRERQERLRAELEGTRDPDEEARIVREIERLRRERPPRWRVARRSGSGDPDPRRER